MLLQSDKVAANFSDRSLLKNLGHFLGIISLAKNQPILYEVSITHFVNLLSTTCKICSFFSPEICQLAAHYFIFQLIAHLHKHVNLALN